MPKCRVHNKLMKEGKYGPYCTTKVGDGWCDEGKKLTAAGDDEYETAAPKAAGGSSQQLATVITQLDRITQLLEVLAGSQRVPVSAIGVMAPRSSPILPPVQARLTADEINVEDIPF
jgi:hypothetical protein